MRRAVLIALAAALWAAPALAVQPDEVLRDPLLESRAREISRELRCLVCQNQSIDDSDADLARDLRVIVRERLVAGDSDEQVLDYVTARYGDFVLLRPPMNPATWLLWFGPAAILLLGAGGLAVALRRRRARPAAGPADLTTAERARLAALLRDEGDHGSPDSTERTP